MAGAGLASSLYQKCGLTIWLQRLKAESNQALKRHAAGPLSSFLVFLATMACGGEGDASIVRYIIDDEHAETICMVGRRE